MRVANSAFLLRAKERLDSKISGATVVVPVGDCVLNSLVGGLVVAGPEVDAVGNCFEVGVAGLVVLSELFWVGKGSTEETGNPVGVVGNSGVDWVASGGLGPGLEIVSVSVSALDTSSLSPGRRLGGLETGFSVVLFGVVGVPGAVGMV